MRPSYQSQRGSALIVAIFVIVVTSLLVATLSGLLRTNNESVVTEVYGTRAFTAAQSGLQQGMNQLFPLDSEMQACPAVDTSMDFSDAKGLQNCEVSIQCMSDNYESDTHYRLIATGECTVGAQVTTRVLAMEARTLE